MIELAILGILFEDDLHGYEVKKRLNELFGCIWNVSYGSLYPALKKLEKAGAVTVISEGRDLSPRTQIPPTGSLGGEFAVFKAWKNATPFTGKAKKVYSITPRGKELFSNLFEGQKDSEIDAISFYIRWSFAQYCDVTARVSLLETRKEQLLSKVSKAKFSLDKISKENPYSGEILNNFIKTSLNETSWIDQLIQKEQLNLPPHQAEVELSHDK